MQSNSTCIFNRASNERAKERTDFGAADEMAFQIEGKSEGTRIKYAERIKLQSRPPKVALCKGARRLSADQLGLGSMVLTSTPPLGNFSFSRGLTAPFGSR